MNITSFFTDQETEVKSNLKGTLDLYLYRQACLGVHTLLSRVGNGQ